MRYTQQAAKALVYQLERIKPLTTDERLSCIPTIHLALTQAEQRGEQRGMERAVELANECRGQEETGLKNGHYLQACHAVIQAIRQEKEEI